MKWLDNFSYTALIAFAILLGLAPFQPQPHLLEKIGMLFQGELTRPLDIFDLVFHSTPLILLAIKFIRDKKRNQNPPDLSK